MKYTEINPTTAEIKFYGYIGTWWINATDFDNTIDEIKRRFKVLNIRVHCYGGEVLEGFPIHNSLMRSGLEVNFYVDGVAASMMPIVMFSGTKRYMADNAFQMFHAPSGGTWGNAKDMFSMGKVLKNMEDIFVRGLMAKSNLSKADADKYLDGSDHWLTAQECLDLGIIDGITDGVDQAKVEKPEAGTPVEKIFGLYAAIATSPIIHQQNNNDMTKEIKQSLIDKHKLQGVTADSSDTAIQAAIDARFLELTNSNQTLQQQNTNTVSLQAEAVISAKEVELKTKFTADQRTKFMAAATSMGIDGLKGILEEIKPVANIVNLLDGKEKEKNDTIVGEDRKDWDLKMWAEKDADGLEAMSKAPAGSKENFAFNALYNAEYKTTLPIA